MSSSFNACAGPSWLAKPGPWATWGYIFTQGLPWTVLAVIFAPTRLLAGSFVAAYLILRMAAVWTMGVWGLHDDLLKRRWWLVPLWDAFAFVLWLNSLFWSRVRWRGVEYRVSGGRLIPVASHPIRAEPRVRLTSIQPQSFALNASIWRRSLAKACSSPARSWLN